MHQQNTGIGGDIPPGVYHRMGSPPPNQISSGITAPEPHPQSPPCFSTHTHSLQQFLMGTPLQGININLHGQPVLHTSVSPTAVAPGVVPLQTGPTSPVGYQQQQLSPPAMARQLHPSTQAILQMTGLQTQAISASANPLQQRSVLNVPLSPGRSFMDPVTGMPVHQVNVSPSSSVQTSNPFVFQDIHKTFPESERSQLSQQSLIVQNLLMPSQQPMGTIHHLGQGSPGRSSMPPLSSPSRASGSSRRSSSYSLPGQKSPTGGGYRRPHSPARTSPLPSSPSLVMRKTMMPQTEERPPANAEVAELRRQVLQERLTDLKKLKETYNDKLTELFYLQNGGNIMDFFAWKKRPNQQLFVYLSSQRMDDEEEKTINDEVKVITNSGSNIPVGTPVAISTQLPPAVSALSSQLNQKAREQKAREMRRNLPGSIQAAAAAAAGTVGGDSEASRKRDYSQAGLDGIVVGGKDKKQLMSSSHEPNVTVTPSMMTAIPSLPGTNDGLSKQQQQQPSQQPAQQQQHSSKGHETSMPSRGLQTISLARTTQPVKSPPGTPSSTSSTQGTPVTQKIQTLASTPSPGVSPAAPSPSRTPKQTPLSPTAQQRLATRQQSLSAVYDYTIGSQEMIVEKAKQEAQVMQRISELRKEGLWAAKRLPKVQEPPRQKTHWDYLLEEMQWLATDFAQERRWKRASARKLVRAVARHHQEQHTREIKAGKEESQKLKKIAGQMAKEIMTFWANIEKVVQYKQQSRLEERRKRVMDLQLDYIVGQTEKYSSWLTEGLNLPTTTSSTTTSVQGSMPSSPRSEGDASAVIGDDADFQPVEDDSDDEETIDVEEKAAEDDADAHAKEIELLQKESELPLEDLLSSLPPGMLDKSSEEMEKGQEDESSIIMSVEGTEETGLKAVTEDVKDDGESSKQDDEFVLSADEEDEAAQDEEETLDEQEANEGAVDHHAEITELEAEGELPIEELMKRYSGAYEDDYEYPHSEESDYAEASELESETEEESEEEGTDGEEEELADIGMEYLINPEKVAEETKPSKQTGQGEPNKEITDIAAAAQSLQPTGYTLSTTQVKTKVPFLLRHTLREYQHIGLDWMVTLHEKKLNGILADEMGLGKTIQTIALFAHLACEEENWGPHLIVVPTSVMLNWEMELKKWSPGFKILTYYGNQKERKQKRQGWTKSNAFHVCITSYKLVIQDHQSFRRKKWKYLVLDEAQNIKNFKSQRWQTLLNFNSQRRLLLTGTPLQNNLMELWSLMHFLMPHVFASHREFREWFSNPLSGMIEGTQEYNEGLIRRLHKVLRPFLLRRLKSEVEKQLPQKYEHVVRCRLSNRQRFLYEDFMSRARTKETLASGHFMSVINVLMQLRKVCNHPDLFEPRPILSGFQMEGINFYTASLALKALEYDPFKKVNLSALNLCIADLEMLLPAYAAHRIRKLQTPRKLIEEIDSSADIPPRLPKLKVKPGKLFTPIPATVQAQPKEVRTASPLLCSGRASPMQQGTASPVLIRTQTQANGGRSSPVVTQFLVRSPGGTQLLRQTSTPPGTPSTVPGVSTFQLTGTSTPGTFTLVSSQSPVVPGATPLQQLPGYTGAATTTTTTTTSLASVVQQRLVLQQQLGAVSGASNRTQFVTSQPITLQLQQLQQNRGRIQIPGSQLQLQPQGGIVRILQTPSGQQIVRQASTPSVIPQQTLLQQHQLLQQRQQQQQRQLQQQVALQSVTGGQQLTVNSQQLVNSIVNQVRTQVTAQPTQTNQVSATPQLARIQQPQLSAVAQVQNALQQQQQQQHLLQQQQHFLQQLQQQQLKLQQTAQTTTTTTTQSLSQPQMVSLSSTLAQAVASTASTSIANKIELKPEQTIPKLQTVQIMRVPRTTPPLTITTTATPVTRSLVPPSPSTPTTPQREAKMSADSPLQPVVKITPLSSVSVAALSAGTMSVKVATSSGTKTTTTPSKTYSTAAALKAKRETARKSPFYLESVEHHVVNDRKATLQRIAAINKIRCSAKPVFGQDLFSAVSIYSGAPPAGGSNPLASGIGHVFSQCVRVLGDGKGQCQYTDALKRLIRSPMDLLVDLDEIFKRYAIVVPQAEAPPISLHTSHPAPSFLTDRKHLRNTLTTELKPRLKCLHHLHMAAKMQFPELRLIQYDCGKLQALNELLRKLKAGDHRALIFTQMTKMLDVLERFLNYNGYIYLRLDGTTRVEQRQVLMERFNADPRLFCFILSTRSGGVGVNLTGADTVIFYDSDWNPTMDAQAQDRCHRIGQTRDVHIYRLVSEMTIEENILKKANQKRLLVDVSIEGGNFTTAFFKETTIKEMFDLSTTGNMSDATEVVVEDLNAKAASVATPPEGDATAKTNLTKEQLEQALARTEDETDVQAASMAHAEQDAELAEFDEDIPYEGEEGKTKEEQSKVEIELRQLDDQLTPIEKYAMQYLELTLESSALEELEEAEEQIEEAKKEWELSRLQEIKEQEERRAEMEDDEILYTYTSEDAQNKVLKNKQAKGKKNRASCSIKSPGTEKRATRRSEPRASARTRSNASSPVLRSRNASPEGSKVVTPLRSGPGSPTRTKVASPERSITLRSDRGRLRSSDEPLSPPPVPPLPVAPMLPVSTSGGARSRCKSSSSASDTARSPPYNAVAAHGWTTRSKRKSMDMAFVDIRVVEKRARAAAAAEKSAAVQQQHKLLEKPEYKCMPQNKLIASEKVATVHGTNDESMKKGSEKDATEHSNTSRESNHEATAESILENILKLTATIESELQSDEISADTTLHGVSQDVIDVRIQATVSSDSKSKVTGENKPAGLIMIKESKPVILNVPKFSPPAVLSVKTKLPLREEPMDLCVNLDNGKAMDPSQDTQVNLTTNPSTSYANKPRVERPRTPIFEKIQSGSPSLSPKLKSPQKPSAVVDCPNVFERLRFPIPQDVGQPISVTPHHIAGERLGLFEKMKSAFALTRSLKSSSVKKLPSFETARLVRNPAVRAHVASTKTVLHIPAMSSINQGTIHVSSKAQVHPEKSNDKPIEIEREKLVENGQTLKTKAVHQDTYQEHMPTQKMNTLVNTVHLESAVFEEIIDVVSVEPHEELSDAQLSDVTNEANHLLAEDATFKEDNTSTGKVDVPTILPSDIQELQKGTNQEPPSTLLAMQQEIPTLRDSQGNVQGRATAETRETSKEIKLSKGTSQKATSKQSNDSKENTQSTWIPLKATQQPMPVPTPVSTSVSTSQSVSAVARLGILKSRSPEGVYSTRSKSPSPDQSSRSPVYDVPKASVLLSDSPTPDSHVSSATIMRYPSVPKPTESIKTAVVRTMLHKQEPQRGDVDQRRNPQKECVHNIQQPNEEHHIIIHQPNKDFSNDAQTSSIDENKIQGLQKEVTSIVLLQQPNDEIKLHQSEKEEGSNMVLSYVDENKPWQPEKEEMSTILQTNKNESKIQQPRKKDANNQLQTNEDESNYQQPEKGSSDILHTNEGECKIQQLEKRASNKLQSNEDKSSYQQPEKGASNILLSNENESNYQQPEKGASNILQSNEDESSYQQPEKGASNILPSNENESNYQQPEKGASNILQSNENESNYQQPEKGASNILQPIGDKSNYQRPEKGASNILQPIEDESNYQQPEKGESNLLTNEDKCKIQQPEKEGASNKLQSNKDESNYQQPEKGASNILLSNENESNYQQPEKGASDILHTNKDESKIQQPEKEGASNKLQLNEDERNYQQPEKGESDTLHTNKDKSKIHQPEQEGASNTLQSNQDENNYQQPDKRESNLLHTNKDESKIQQPERKEANNKLQSREDESNYQQPDKRERNLLHTNTDECKIQQPEKEGASNKLQSNEDERNYQQPEKGASNLLHTNQDEINIHQLEKGENGTLQPNKDDIQQIKNNDGKIQKPKESVNKTLQSNKDESKVQKPVQEEASKSGEDAGPTCKSEKVVVSRTLPSKEVVVKIQNTEKESNVIQSNKDESNIEALEIDAINKTKVTNAEQSSTIIVAENEETDASKICTEYICVSEAGKRPLHLDVDNQTAPSLVRQTPVIKLPGKASDGELEMPQISPVLKLGPPITEDSARHGPPLLTNRSPLLKQSTALVMEHVAAKNHVEKTNDSSSVTVEGEEKSLRNVETVCSVSQAESVDQPHTPTVSLPGKQTNVNTVAVISGTTNEVPTKMLSTDYKKTVDTGDANTNRIQIFNDSKQKDDKSDSSSDSESSSEDEDTPRTTRAKSALLAAQERRQLRSEGRGFLMRPMPYKPSLHKGKVKRKQSPARRPSLSHSTTSQSDSSPSSQKRGRPFKFRKVSTDSDSSPQHSASPNLSPLLQKHESERCRKNSKGLANSESSPQRSESQRGRGRPRKYHPSKSESSLQGNKGSQASFGNKVSNNSDQSRQGNTSFERGRPRKYSSRDNTSSSGPDTRTKNRILSKSVSTNQRPSTEEPVLCRRTRSGHNSPATSGSSSAANSRDGSPASTHNANVLTRQRRVSGRSIRTSIS